MTKGVFRILISKLLSFQGVRETEGVGRNGNFERTYVRRRQTRRRKLSFSFLFYLLFAMDQPLSPFHLHSCTLAFFPWDDAFPKVRHVGSCDLTISVRFHAVYFYFCSFLSSFLFFNQLKGAQSISSLFLFLSLFFAVVGK